MSTSRPEDPPSVRSRTIKLAQTVLAQKDLVLDSFKKYEARCEEFRTDLLIQTSLDTRPTQWPFRRREQARYDTVKVWEIQYPVSKRPSTKLYIEKEGTLYVKTQPSIHGAELNYEALFVLSDETLSDILAALELQHQYLIDVTPETGAQPVIED